ncbi:MAG: hypothetical protein M5R36_19915 [Deltaproteobacteria bacterium]|nr:hypothetical protein [Deltaproteobacteria bacterium]
MVRPRSAGARGHRLRTGDAVEILYRSGDATHLRSQTGPTTWDDAAIAALGRAAAGQLAYYADGGRAVVRVVEESTTHALRLVDDLGGEILDEDGRKDATPPSLFSRAIPSR